MARRKIVAGNWKMNMTPSQALALVEELKPLVASEEVDVDCWYTVNNIYFFTCY